MDLRKLKKLIDLVEESGITELEVTEGEEKVRIVKHSASASQAAYMMQTAPLATAAAAHLPSANPSQESDQSAGQVFKSPMVGTFYRSANPGSGPLVEVGSIVKSGDTLCILEAMQLRNEIESEFSGTVKAILVKDGLPVEYGEPLFIIG